MIEFQHLIHVLSKVAKAQEAIIQWSETVDWEKVLERMQYTAIDLPNDLENESIKLMNRGWFIWFFDGDRNDFSGKIEALIGKSDEEQDSYLCRYVTDNIGYFESEIHSQQTDRACQIRDAFKSHDCELFYASIPTLLALSEGIWRDFYPKHGLFAKQRSRGGDYSPKTDEIIDLIPYLMSLERAALTPLRVSSAITKSIHSPTERDKKLLNRHLIMHGNSNSYGSKENSLKAISLVFFVHKCLEHLKNAAITSPVE